MKQKILKLTCPDCGYFEVPECPSKIKESGFPLCPCGTFMTIMDTRLTYTDEPTAWEDFLDNCDEVDP